MMPVTLPWGVHDPREDGWWCYATEAEATAKAEALIESCCADGGWDEQTDEIVVSLVMHSPVKRLLHERTAEMTDDQWYDLCGEGSDEHDEWFTYDLTRSAVADAMGSEVAHLRAEVERLTNENEALNRGVIHWTDEALRLTAERDELRCEIVGCGCPAPYDTCPHSEPLAMRVDKLTAERDAALAALAPHEALVAELREMPAEWAGAAPVLLARHGLGGDA